MDGAGAQPRERLAEEGAAGLPDVLEGEALEDVDLGAEAPHEPGGGGLDGARLRSHPLDLGEHLGEGDEGAEGDGARRRCVLGAVGELLDAVHHPHRQRLAAGRAAPFEAAGLRRLEADVAGAVAVQVVLPLLGEELDGAGVPLPRLERLPDGEVVHLGREGAGLAPQHRRRVGVRVADQGEAVELRHPPVHRRVGGEAGLDGEDVRREVAVAVVDRVESRLRAQGREPGGPDVGGDEVGVGAALQGDLEQVARVEPEDRPPVRRDVADRRQLLPEAPGGVEVRRVDQVVDLARPLTLLVDRRDLDLEQEAHRTVAGGRELPLDLALDLRAQAEEPRLGGDELGADLLEPGGMGEIAGPDHRDPLAPRPQRQVLEIGVAAGRPRVAGMDVEIGVEHRGVTESGNRREGIAVVPFCPDVPCSFITSPPPCPGRR